MLNYREVTLKPETTATDSAMSLFTSLGVTQNRMMKSIMTSVESAPTFGGVREVLAQVVIDENGLDNCDVEFFRNGFQLNDRWVLPGQGTLELTYVVRQRSAPKQ